MPLALLTGCMVGPDYKRPQATTIPASYTEVSSGWKIAEPQGQFPKGNWWEMFDNPELNALEVQATAANQELKAAVARFAEARATVDVTRAGLFPNVSLSGSYARARISPNEPSKVTGRAIGEPATFNDLTVPLDLQYELDVWGRIRRSVESAQAQLAATADDVGTVQLDIEAEVAVDYFTLRALDSELAVLHSSVEVFSKSFELTTNRFAGGIANELEVAQAQTVLETTQAQLPAVALQRAQFEHALAVLVGQPAPAFQISTGALSTTPPLIPPGLPSELLERRPDIASVERLMAAANANIGVAKAAFFPTVQLDGLAGFESISAGTLFNWSSRYWALGPTLTLPLFEGGRLRAGVRFAWATYNETVANYRQTVLAAFQDVEDNLAAQSLLANQYDAENRALVAARDQLQAANNRYEDGLVTYLEVATAETTALNVEFTTVQLRGQQLVAAVSLVKSLGGGWRESQVAERSH